MTISSVLYLSDGGLKETEEQFDLKRKGMRENYTLDPYHRLILVVDRI